ncbi:glutamate receptor ionotropic, delta-2-like isoform X1 [Tachypleus tridentatus]|uniref:glutamate receptor ionotropic, delta-2-like isoform X1 n=1 Tax=Tachypleus tridentatus TaxID=6853 RepID=UPI003FD0862D
MSGLHLRVAVEEWEPWVWVKETEDGNVTIRGPMADVLNILAKAANFTYSLKVPKDHQWGMILPNGSWTGMIGMMVQNEADLGLGPFAVNYDRHMAVDVTPPIFIDYNTILVSYKQKQPNFYSYLQAFGWEVWVAMFASLLTISGVACLADYLILDNIPSKRGFLVFFKYIWRFYGNLFYQSSSYTFHFTHRRVLQAFWWMTVIVLMQSFSGHLMATLVMDSGNQIDDLSELDKTNIQPAVEIGSSLHSMFMVVI